MSKIDNWCEFSTEVANKYGIDLAILHGFFKKFQYLNSIHQDKSCSYPTLFECYTFLTFWDEEKIRSLIAELNLTELIN